MKNLKYHILNIISVIIFSYITAETINLVIKYNISPTFTKSLSRKKTVSRKAIKKSFDDYSPIIESGFFKVADSSEMVTSEGIVESVSSIDHLTLLGTITGPSSIARAMIKKRGEKNPGIFALRKINDEISNDDFGYKLVSIKTSKVYLEQNGQKSVLDMFAKKEKKPFIGGKRTSSSSGRNIKKNISRAEIKQKVLNNLDNAMKGLVAGPYRKGGKIVGFRLKKVRPYNILYKLGARSGDIVKRINGKTINSTEKLYKMWSTLQNESKISVDIERGGSLVTFDLNITE